VGQEQLDPQVLQDFLEAQDLVVPLVIQVLQAQMVFQEAQAHRDLKGLRDQLEALELLDSMVEQVSQDSLDP
jgi:hypothetical protein